MQDLLEVAQLTAGDHGYGCPILACSACAPTPASLKPGVVDDV